MPTGGFVGFSPVTRSSGNAGAASIFLTPLVAQQNGSAVALLLDAPSATSGTTFKALIYDSAHSALLASSAQITAIAANYNRIPFTVPLSLVAGTTYYVGYVCSTSLPVSIQTSGGPASWFVSGSQSVASPANPLVGGATAATTLMMALELDGAGTTGFGFSADQASGVTLSLSNTAASYPAGTATRGARSVATHVSGSGKWYAEILVGGTINSTVGIGLATANLGMTQGITVQSYIALLYPNGNLQLSSGAPLALGLTYISGDVIGIAYDATANLVWFNKNNGAWFGASSTAGNPAGGTGGAGFQATQWPVTVAAATGATPTAAILTLRDIAGALQYAPPSGFSPWSSAATSVLAATDNIDSAAFAGTVTAAASTGMLAATEPRDTAAFAGLAAWTGALAATDAPDTAAVTGEAEPFGTLAATEPRDTAYFAGVVVDAIHGTLGPTDPPDKAYFFRGGPPQASLDRPPVIPLVASDLGNVRATHVRFATTINQILRGALGATMGVTLVPNGTSSAFSDSRIGPYTSVQLHPTSANAQALLHSIWVETTKGSVTFHHANVPYTDLTYTVCLIG